MARSIPTQVANALDQMSGDSARGAGIGAESAAGGSPEYDRLELRQAWLRGVQIGRATRPAH